MIIIKITTITMKHHYLDKLKKEKWINSWLTPYNLIIYLPLHEFINYQCKVFQISTTFKLNLQTNDPSAKSDLTKIILVIKSMRFDHKTALVQ